MCEYNLINSINNFINASSSAANNGSIKSENTDGYSATYLTASEISNVVKSKQEEINDTIRSYLLNVIVDNEHIMYCGVK